MVDTIEVADAQFNGQYFGSQNAVPDTTIFIDGNEPITGIEFSTSNKSTYGSPAPPCNLFIRTTVWSYGPYGVSTPNHDCNLATSRTITVPENNSFLEFMQNNARANSEGMIYFL